MTGVLSQLSKEILQHFQWWENAQKTNLEGNFTTLPPQTPNLLISKGRRAVRGGWGLNNGIHCRVLCNCLGFSPILLQWLWEKIPIHGRVCSLQCLEFTSASHGTSGQQQPAVRAHCGNSNGSEAQTVWQLWIFPWLCSGLWWDCWTLQHPLTAMMSWGRQGRFLFGVSLGLAQVQSPVPQSGGAMGGTGESPHRVHGLWAPRLALLSWDLCLSHTPDCGCHHPDTEHRDLASVTSRHL